MGRKMDLGSGSLAGLARRAAEVEGDAAERAEWLRRAAETARSIGDAEGAIECYGRLIEERPRDTNARAALVELHRARGDALRSRGILGKAAQCMRHGRIANPYRMIERPASMLEHFAPAVVTRSFPLPRPLR